MTANALIEAHLFDIGRATVARDLHALHAGVCADEALDNDEKETLYAAIDQRFSVLNRLAATEMKPRWN